MLTSTGAGGWVTGACQVTDAPLPLNVPTLAVHKYCNCATGVSSSCTSALTATDSPRSAKFGGSPGRLPWMPIVVTLGGLLTGGGGGGGGGGGAIGETPQPARPTHQNSGPNQSGEPQN